MHFSALSNPHQAAPELAGQAPLLAYLASQLQASSPVRVVLLHGAPGAGKSAVIDAVAACWSDDGGTVETVRLGDLASPTASADEQQTRRLVVVDFGPVALPVDLDAWNPLLGSLGPHDRLLVAARIAADLPVDDARLVEVRVEALGWDDAHALLTRHGVPSEGRDALVRWAAGSPLHLVLAAQQWGRQPGFDPATDGVPADLASRLLRRFRGAPTVAFADGGPSLGAAPGIRDPARGRRSCRSALSAHRRAQREPARDGDRAIGPR
jgi:hypothetical protein